MNRKDLQDLAKIRIAEAQALLKAGLPDGAFYLAGYSVECGLKACIAKATREYEFPDKKSVDAGYTHNLRDLVRVANLDSAVLEQSAREPGFRIILETVQKWSEQSRYERHDLSSATELINAVANEKYGVLKWIEGYW